MKKKASFLWYLLVINTIINGAILVFPIQKEINIPQKIEIQTEEKKTKILEVNTLLKNEKIKYKVNGIEKSTYEVNVSNLKNNKLGSYYILYKLKIGKNREVDFYQKVKVVDNVKPTIILENKDTVEIKKNSKYQDTYMAIDNYDGDITDKVKVKGKVDTKKEGTYILTYEVEDTSKNKTEKKQTVTVTEEEENKKEEKISSYTIKDMNFYKKGIKVKMQIPNKKEASILKIGEKSISLPTNTTTYEGKIDLTSYKNGIYEVKIKGKDILCEIDPKDRLQRAHIGKKMITILYPKKGNIKIKIEPFQYQYDILIDPGHGGEDEGAMENGYIEKDINLEQSLYEKRRFEEHGLKVKMIREDDTYGEMMGEDSWHRVTKRAFAIGYYGSVSKISYSNHHNATTSKEWMGWEILVPASLTYDELKEEHQIIERWMDIYPLKENHIRMYARDFENGNIYNKINGQIYTIKNYYAVNRIPYKSYFIKVPIFEGAFISNQEDFTWYYQNYKKLSEQKIKTYVEALGLTYKKPKEEA